MIRASSSPRVFQSVLWRSALVALALLAPLKSGAQDGDATLPFGPGEVVQMKISYLHMHAGRARMSVAATERGGRALHQFVVEAWTEGFFPRLFRYRVQDRSMAIWDPATQRSLGIEKHLREGRHVRDQIVAINPETGVALVEDQRIRQKRFELPSNVLDVISAFFVTRLRGVPEETMLKLPVFDNGKHYELGVRFLGRERLDLPEPLGIRSPTIIIEPMLVEGSGLFVKKGKLKIWLTDDERRIPVRMRSKVPIGSVSADLELYIPPERPHEEPAH